jgi:hypothetical protein
MLQALVQTANQLLSTLQRSLFRPRLPAPSPSQAPSPLCYEPLERVQLTDEVGRTLFEEYAQHRSAGHGNEETGWILLGLRQPRDAVVLATLPAGSEADAGVAHIRFNSSGQALGSRIVRQTDKRLSMLGVVHTHPGSLRHPSKGDYRGDSEWVRQLRGREGIFGIGTADALPEPGGVPLRGYQPRPHVQCWGELRFTWYALRHNDTDYRPLPIDLVYGPDLARPLHAIWATLERHAEQLERLVRQQIGVQFQAISDDWGPGLVVHIPLAERGDAIRVLIRPKEVRYYLVRNGEHLEVEHSEAQVDRGVYLLLAELAASA